MTDPILSWLDEESLAGKLNAAESRRNSLGTEAWARPSSPSLATSATSATPCGSSASS